MKSTVNLHQYPLKGRRRQWAEQSNSPDHKLFSSSPKKAVTSVSKPHVPEIKPHEIGKAHTRQEKVGAVISTEEKQTNKPMYMLKHARIVCLGHWESYGRHPLIYTEKHLKCWHICTKVGIAIWLISFSFRVVSFSCSCLLAHNSQEKREQ